MTGTAQPPPIKGHVTPWSYLLPRRSEAGHTGYRPFVTLMISDLGSPGKPGPSPQYGLSIQMGSGVISSCGFAPGLSAPEPLTVKSGRTVMSWSR
jgi:hypothetical protein